MAKLSPDKSLQRYATASELQAGLAPTRAEHPGSGSVDADESTPGAESGSTSSTVSSVGSEVTQTKADIESQPAEEQGPTATSDEDIAVDDAPTEGPQPIDPAPRDDRVSSLTERRRSALAEARRNGLPPKVDSWRKRTATGAVLTGFALGFREALGLEPQRPAIVMEAPGDPPTDLPIDAEVGQIRPADNVVRIRPWLLNGQEGVEEPAGGDTADPDKALFNTAAPEAAVAHKVDPDSVEPPIATTEAKPRGYLGRRGRKSDRP